MKSNYPAHIRKDGDNEIIQSVEEHCRNTAKIAAQLMEPEGLYHIAYLAGLVHDAGKFTQAFSKYIRKAANGEPVTRGSVNHTFTGVKLLLDRYNNSTDIYKKWTTQIATYAAGAHHGLFDCIDENRKSGFIHRVKKDDDEYRESVSSFFNYCSSENELNDLMEQAAKEINVKLNITAAISKTPCDYMFYTGLLIRLILSTVIEGDRQDTKNFMEAVPYKSDEITNCNNWLPVLDNIENRLNTLPTDTEINKTRRLISDQCKAFAVNPTGIYQLNVPTGSGKTLSSLRFAVAHALEQKKQRIIFLSPLLSILDQNAKEIRKYVNNDDIILEHHSNVIQTKENGNELDNMELLMENWDSPIIITTLVQFLNTLFSGKTSSIRRFHSLCDSVIVIDEVQTVPNKMLSLFHLAVNFLNKFCNATIVLCSATQPCHEESEHPMLIDPDRADIVHYDEKIWNVFKRTEIQNAGRYKLEDIPDLIRQKIQHCSSLLVICNRKDEAETLYHSFENDPSVETYHLSASMCMAHRKETLESLKDSLSRSFKNKAKTLCISTQVIEAGVDISFECVMRLSAGLDSVIQSAGRCNRNGEYPEIKPVYVIDCKDENLQNLKEIQQGKDAFLALSSDFVSNPEKYQEDYSSDASVQRYYHYLYRKYMKEGYQDFLVKHNSENLSIMSLLSMNEKYADEDCDHYETGFVLNQAFRLAGSLFQVFDNDTFDVIVPYGEGNDLIEKILSPKANYDMKYLHTLLDEAKPFMVSMYNYQYKKLMDSGLITFSQNDSIPILNPLAYDTRLGVVVNKLENSFLEVN